MQIQPWNGVLHQRHGRIRVANIQTISWVVFSFPFSDHLNLPDQAAGYPEVKSDYLINIFKINGLSGLSFNC